ncbi:MAG TPA: hypothetical protein PKM45_07480 [Giesbergeria sp.]|nr:hypothetical protein [Giesbergeria sp.]
MYVLPPDTVQALGGPQVLDATVAQTHTPTNAGAIVPRGFKPRLFFNNGGLVQDEEQKPKPISPTNIYPQGSPGAGANVYGGAIDAAKSAVSAAANPQGGQPLANGAAQVFGQREALQQQGRERWDASVAARQPAPQPATARSFPGAAAADPGARINEQIATAQRQQAERMAAAQRTQAYDSVTQQQRQQAYDTWQNNKPWLMPTPQHDTRLQAAEKSYTDMLAGRTASTAPAPAAPVPAQTSQVASGAGGVAPERTPEQIAKLVGGLDRHHAQDVQLQAAARTPEQARAEAVQQTTGQQVQGLPGVYQHGRGQYSDNPQGMGFAPGFTGQPSAQNLAAADALARQQQAQSAARVAAAQQEPAARGFPGFAAPEISHSGNDWSTRNELRSLRMAAERAMENAPRKRFAAQHPAVQAYQAALQADMAARTGGQAALQAKTNDTNAGLVREQMQQQGATQRDMARNAIEQQRVGLDGQRLGLAAQQQQEQSLARSFDIRAAQRREGILQQFDAAKTDQERAQLRQRYPDVFGDTKTNSPWKVSVTPATKNVDGSTSMGSVIRYNEQTGQVEEVKLNGAAPPLPAPEDPSKRVVGQAYTNANGQTAIWTGQGWQLI